MSIIMSGVNVQGVDFRTDLNFDSIPGGLFNITNFAGVILGSNAGYTRVRGLIDQFGNDYNYTRNSGIEKDPIFEDGIIKHAGRTSGGTDLHGFINPDLVNIQTLEDGRPFLYGLIFRRIGTGGGVVFYRNAAGSTNGTGLFLTLNVPNMRWRVVRDGVGTNFDFTGSTSNDFIGEWRYITVRCYGIPFGNQNLKHRSGGDSGETSSTHNFTVGVTTPTTRNLTWYNNLEFDLDNRVDFGRQLVYDLTGFSDTQIDNFETLLVNLLIEDIVKLKALEAA